MEMIGTLPAKTNSARLSRGKRRRNRKIHNSSKFSDQLKHVGNEIDDNMDDSTDRYDVCLTASSLQQ